MVVPTHRHLLGNVEKDAEPGGSLSLSDALRTEQVRGRQGAIRFQIQHGDTSVEHKSAFLLYPVGKEHMGRRRGEAGARGEVAQPGRAREELWAFLG